MTWSRTSHVWSATTTMRSRPSASTNTSASGLLLEPQRHASGELAELARDGRSCRCFAGVGADVCRGARELLRREGRAQLVVAGDLAEISLGRQRSVRGCRRLARRVPALDAARAAAVVVAAVPAPAAGDCSATDAASVELESSRCNTATAPMRTTTAAAAPARAGSQRDRRGRAVVVAVVGATGAVSAGSDVAGASNSARAASIACSRDDVVDGHGGTDRVGGAAELFDAGGEGRVDRARARHLAIEEGAGQLVTGQRLIAHRYPVGRRVGDRGSRRAQRPPPPCRARSASRTVPGGMPSTWLISA